jgi:hypothetical protein
MTTRYLIAASLLALAACGSKGDGNSTAAGGGGGLLGGGPVALQPGEWEMKMEVVDFKAPGMPPEVAARMKQAPTVNRHCVTEEEAKGPKPENFAPQQNGRNCKQDDLVWGNGRIHNKTSCAGENGSGNMTMEMDGTYTPTSMDISVKNETETAHVTTSMEMRLTGRRVGECPAGEAGKEG